MKIAGIAGIAGALAAAAVAIPGLYLARRLHRQGFQPNRSGDALDLQITAVSDQTVTLRRAAKAPSIAADVPGDYLLEGARGWGYAGRVIDSNAVMAIREYRHGGGDIRAGDYARLDSYAHPQDPRAAHGIDFEDVTITSPIGGFPAWYVPGKGATWAVVTHGKGANRRESLRILPALLEAGFHCLVISYRNDIDCPPAASGRYSYGLEEWEDLDAAVSFALSRGAGDIVLVGYSMGGAITLSFMANSANAGRVSALVLDAPMWHFEDTVTHGAKLAGLPLRFLAVSNRIAAWKYRFSWANFDYLKSLPALNVPVLLFHGDADRTIPVELSDRAARMRPDIITYVRVPKAGHVRAWNTGPAAYQRTVLEFVRTKRSVSTG